MTSAAKILGISADYLSQSQGISPARYDWIRLRFATTSIAPADLPHFRYVASVLAHNSIHYTAIIPDTTLDDAITAVRDAWDDAIIHVAEVCDGEFSPHDLALRPPVYGVASQSMRPQPGILQRAWRWAVGDAKNIRAMRAAHESNQQLKAME